MSEFAYYRVTSHGNVMFRMEGCSSVGNNRTLWLPIGKAVSDSHVTTARLGKIRVATHATAGRWRVPSYVGFTRRCLKALGPSIKTFSDLIANPDSVNVLSSYRREPISKLLKSLGSVPMATTSSVIINVVVTDAGSGADYHGLASELRAAVNNEIIEILRGELPRLVKSAPELKRMKDIEETESEINKLKSKLAILRG